MLRHLVSPPLPKIQPRAPSYCSSGLTGGTRPDSLRICASRRVGALSAPQQPHFCDHFSPNSFILIRSHCHIEGTANLRFGKMEALRRLNPGQRQHRLHVTLQAATAHLCGVFADRSIAEAYRDGVKCNQIVEYEISQSCEPVTWSRVRPLRTPKQLNSPTAQSRRGNCEENEPRLSRQLWPFLDAAPGWVLINAVVNGHETTCSGFEDSNYWTGQ
jgi:hypothetical protein